MNACHRVQSARALHEVARRWGRGVPQGEARRSGLGGLWPSDSRLSARLADVIMTALENIAEVFGDAIAGATEGVDEIGLDMFIAH